jgi:catechol 2,3-dioxygenase-like lactoylglutathione lyase family enzyme
MAVLGVHHAGRTVKDMDRALTFYRDLLGLSIVDDDMLEGPEVSEMVGLPNAKLRAVMLSIDGSTPFLELIEYSRPASLELTGAEQASDVGNSHFCLLVDSMQAEVQRLAAAGVRFTGSPLLADAGLFVGQWAAYCFDPDGLIVELWSHNP